MILTNKLLKLAAKVALDKLIGDKRTDELDVILKEWSAEQDKARELEEAKKLAADSEEVAKAVVEVTKGTETVTKKMREAVEFAVATGIAALEAPPSKAKDWDIFLPGTMKTFVILSSDVRLIGSGPDRFFHFNWYKDGYSVRDYIGNRILQPRENGGDEGGLEFSRLDMSALGVWNASTVRIQALSKYNLDFAITDQGRWTKVLGLLGETARQMKKT